MSSMSTWTQFGREDGTKKKWSNPGFRTSGKQNALTDRTAKEPTSYPYSVDKHHGSPRDYKLKEEEVFQEKINDLDEVPFYLRESIQKIIDKRINKRVNEEMANFKDQLREQFQ